MVSTSQNGQKQLTGIKYALGEQPLFQPVQHVRVANRYPAGHYGLPGYLRGKSGVVKAVIEPVAG